MIFSIIPFNGELGERFRFSVNFTKHYSDFICTKASRIIGLEKFTRFPYNSYVLVLRVTPLFSLEKFSTKRASSNGMRFTYGKRCTLLVEGWWYPGSQYIRLFILGTLALEIGHCPYGLHFLSGL